MTEQVDGSFTAVLAAPTSPGAAPVSATITTADGVVVIPDAVTVLFVGPVSAAESEIHAEPDRIRFDGQATSLVTAVPRDVMGQPLGPGRTVVLSLEGPGALSPWSDAGDGSYHGTLTAPLTESRADVVLVSVDGAAAGTRAAVVFGFDLEEVILEVRGDVTDLLASPATPEKSLKKLENAGLRLDAALEKILISDVSRALKKVVGAAKNLEKARRRSSDSLDLEPQLRELAQSARQSASEVIESAAPSNPKEEKKLVQARTQLDKGDILFEEGKHSKAVKKFLKAFRKAEKL